MARDDCRERLAGTGTMADPETFVQGNILYLAATALTAEGYITWPALARPGDPPAWMMRRWPGCTGYGDTTMDQDIWRRAVKWQPPLLQALKAQANFPFVYDWWRVTTGS